MATLRNSRVLWVIPVIIALLALSPVRVQAKDGRPIADAGSSRYAGPDPIVLDGTGSYAPDNSDAMSYMWRQISGPAVTITDANTATPTISGFVQTDEIQECEFELIIKDGELTSLPDGVKVIIVPTLYNNVMLFDNELFGKAFDPQKPTVIYFGGGGGDLGLSGGGGRWGSGGWREKANIIFFDPYLVDPPPGQYD